jgi:hypothetical protein
MTERSLCDILLSYLEIVFVRVLLVSAYVDDIADYGATYLRELIYLKVS